MLWQLLAIYCISGCTIFSGCKKWYGLVAFFASWPLCGAIDSEAMAHKIAQDHFSKRGKLTLFLNGQPVDACAFHTENGTRYSVGFDSTVISGVQAVKDLSISTVRYFPENPQIAALSRFNMPVLTGMGNIQTSHAGTAIWWMRVLAKLKIEDETARLVRQLARQRGFENLPAMYMEAFDWPMSGNALGHVEMNAANSLWAQGTSQRTVSTFVRAVKARGNPNNPTVPLCQSAGCAFIGSVSANSIIGSEIDGQILVGPVVPGSRGGAESEERFHQLVAQGAFKPNYETFYWAARQIAGMDWADVDDPFHGKPTLILLGEFDQEIPQITKDWLHTLPARLPHVEVYVVPGAGHAVLNNWKQLDEQGNVVRTYKPSLAYVLIYEFLKRRFPHAWPEETSKK